MKSWKKNYVDCHGLLFGGIEKVRRLNKRKNYNYHINRINIDVKRIKEVLHITTEDFGVIKQFAFKDVYYKKLNNKIINKYLTKLKQQ